MKMADDDKLRIKQAKFILLNKKQTKKKIKNGLLMIKKNKKTINLPYAVRFDPPTWMSQCQLAHSWPNVFLWRQATR